MNGPRLLTIGLYGFTEDGFFSALTAAKVDTFCDVRRRRGVRGSLYAFANRRRLQDRLERLGIRYLHLKELSPPEDVRDLQRRADDASAVRHRDRTRLSEAFLRAYTARCLDGLDSRAFLHQLGVDAGVIALFCVERLPGACHRSLLAARLADDLGLRPEHIVPPAC